jgi:hypothetical protein
VVILLALPLVALMVIVIVMTAVNTSPVALLVIVIVMTKLAPMK